MLWVATAFAVATAVVVVVGPRLARVAEELTDRLDIGEVLAGALLLGVVTSLPGLVLTVSAAARGETDLAVANALGGVAAQTAFLAIADVVHGAGALSNRVPIRQVAFQGALLMVLLALVVIGLGTASTVVGGVHPVSVALVVAYLGGLQLGRSGRRHAAEARDDTASADTAPDVVPADEQEGGRAGLRGKLGELEDAPAVEAEQASSWTSLWARFVVFAALLSAAGYALARSGSSIASSTPLSASAVGVALTAVATSTPELVTAVAAARRGAIGLAAGDIIGGNAFDTLFVAAADVAAGGSVFAAAGPDALGFAGLAILLNGLLLAGLVRPTAPPRRVDTESVVIIAVWLAAIVLIVV